MRTVPAVVSIEKVLPAHNGLTVHLVNNSDAAAYGYVSDDRSYRCTATDATGNVYSATSASSPVKIRELPLDAAFRVTCAATNAVGMGDPSLSFRPIFPGLWMTVILQVRVSDTTTLTTIRDQARSTIAGQLQEIDERRL